MNNSDRQDLSEWLKELADKFGDIREMIDQIATLIEPEDEDESEEQA